MKKRFCFVPFIVLVCGIVVTGCGGAPAALQLSHENWGGFGEESMLPVKDFEPLGFVFTSTTFRVDSKGGITGNTFSYQDLLREAQALGAHAIINVTIDRQISFVKTDMGRRVQVETWRGSALAVKYTNVLTNPDIKVNEARKYNLTGGGSTVIEPSRGGKLLKSSE